jgi:hypothetical protein
MQYVALSQSASLTHSLEQNPWQTVALHRVFATFALNKWQTVELHCSFESQGSPDGRFDARTQA